MSITADKFNKGEIETEEEYQKELEKEQTRIDAIYDQLKEEHE